MLNKLINNLTYELCENKTCFESEKIKNIIDKFEFIDFELYTKDINKNNFNRILLYRNNIYEIFLIMWPKNYISKIHNHSENGCFLKLIKGKLKEEIYTSNLQLIKSNIIEENKVGFMTNNIGYHTIVNIFNDISISLHIYSPSNFITKYFN